MKKILLSNDNVLYVIFLRIMELIENKRNQIETEPNCGSYMGLIFIKSINLKKTEPNQTELHMVFKWFSF